MITEDTFIINGQKIAAKRFNAPTGIPTIAVHGWLDNAASFDNLAPLLPDHHIVAIDLPGHGYSDHLGPNQPYRIADFAVMGILVAQHLGWSRFALLGHSLGGAICSLIASIINDRILYSIMIDGLGPLSTQGTYAPKQFKLYIDDLLSKPHRASPQYTSKEEALQARLNVTPMDRNSVATLLSRGLKQLDSGAWIWRTDPRLLAPSPVQLTEEQVLAFLHEISCPVSVIRPNPGYPFPHELVKNRVAAVKNAQLTMVDGHHHVHLDAASLVADAINSFVANLK